MPTNVKKVNRLRKKNIQKPQEFLEKQNGQEYGIVTRLLGDSRLEVKCMDNKTRVCHIRGKMKNKVWIMKDDIILIGKRDYQDDRGDVIHKYSNEDRNYFKGMGIGNEKVEEEYWPTEEIDLNKI